MSQHPAPNSEVKLVDVRFLLLPLPEFNMLPFGGFLDKLRFSADEEDYSQQRYCQWTVAGLGAGTITSSSGITIEAQHSLAEVNFAEFDYLIVFGGRSAQASMQLAPDYQPLLRKAAKQGIILVSIDNACFMLAAAGLLNGKKTAVHWRHEQEFNSAFPHIPTITEQLYCIDGKRISCAGGAAAIELAIELLSRHSGRTRALKGLADMLVDEARQQHHHLKSLQDDSQSGAFVGRHVKRAIAIMRQQLSLKISVEDVSAQLGISRRQLDRLFTEGYQMTAKDYWLMMKMNHAKWRISNSTMSLQLIAEEVGVSDVSYFCKVFKRHFGITPGSLR
ncbi:AraC family transcriptional regulator [Photobacterium sanctipauli]|uniref:AraC family transcriptional regulator n=1 Tax=Photobacterium sanctipauli TaxID=1342794 RepID=A0A2T3NN40_9GAMM|nr:helix-turn-helix domain-containing protein [Photobacterium sanctipauli]PSW16878.1 AraC family transcriptional regulator [Photobacterium sanctipauli]